MKKTAEWAECAKAMRELALTLPIDEMLALFPRKKQPKIKRKWNLASADPDGLRFYVCMERVRNRLRNFRKWVASIRIRDGVARVAFFGRVFSLSFYRKRGAK